MKITLEKSSHDDDDDDGEEDIGMQRMRRK